MKETTVNTKLDFLSVGGEMGERIRNFDWSKTSLGPIEKWTQSLRTTVGLVLAQRFPMMLWWGPDYISIYNDAYIPVLGDKHPWGLGKPVKECWSEVWDVLQPLIDSPFYGGPSTWIEDFQLLLNRNKFSEEAHFTVAYSPVPDETTVNRIGGVLATVHEITEKIIHERAMSTLRQLGAIAFEEKSLDVICQNVADALGKNQKDFPFALVYKITGDNNVITIAASTGINEKQHVFPEIIDTANPTDITKEFCEAFRENKIVVSELKAEDSNLPKGAWEIAPVQFVHIPVSAAGAGHPHCIISAALNPFRKFDDIYKEFCQLISDRVSLEINKMLAVDEEKKRAKALAEIDKAKTVFFSNISHEFRTPLTLMLSPLEELLNQHNSHFSESEKNNIETSHRNAMRLLKLVNTLLDFSSIEAGRQQAAFSLVDIVPLTKNLAANFRSVIEKAGLKLIIKADSIIQPVYVDKQMWEKIIFNLLSNAFKYTLEGKITVELTAEPEYAVLKVIDTGIGIPEHELPKMFARFHRVQNVSGRTFEGTGIGLSLIKELVQMHEGTIGVESKLNSGSTFTVKIPFGKGHIKSSQISKIERITDQISSNIYVDEIDDILKAAEKTLKSKSSTERSESDLPIVLVVDDNADMREHISSVLSTNYNVITANNGVDALQKIRETVPALVLSDIMMPVMDGISLLKEIKSNIATSNIPVIFLTARAGEESKIEGWETGADDYLLKPFSAKELVSRVKAQVKIIKLRNELETNVHNLFMHAPAIICVVKGPQHVYELANEMYLQLIGNRDVIGKPVRAVLPELEETGIFEILDNIYVTGEPFIGNEMLMKLDKGKGGLEDVYLNFVYQPSYDSEGEIDGILVHGVDVTEQVMARIKIEESEKRYHNMIYTSPSLIAIFKGKDMIIDIANDAILESWGKGKDIIGKSLMEVMPEIVEQGFEKLLLIVYNTGEPYYAYEMPVTLIKNGKPELMTYTFVYQAQHNANGEIEGVAVIATEVTPQAEQNKKIKESESRFRNLVEKAITPICILKGEDLILEMANDLVLAIWQVDEEAIGKPLLEILPEMKDQPIITGLLDVYHNGVTLNLDEIPAHFVRKNGKMETSYFNCVYQPYQEVDGIISGVIAMAVDITNQVEARRKIEESEKLLEQKVIDRTEQLNEKNSELLKMNKELEAFTYISSHDLQEPLRKIQTFAGRILANERDHLSETAKDYFDRMNNAATRMQTLIQDLLAFSRISTSERKFEHTKLNKIIEEVKEEFKETLEEKNATIVSEEMGELNIIPFQFRQLMQNLINNALKFARPNVPSRIIIKSMTGKGSEMNNKKLLSDKEYSFISVSDNGIGFDKEYSEKIFEVFQKLHGKDEYAGTGIGLAIVKKIVDNHNGIITAESELGKGVTFNIYIPK